MQTWMVIPELALCGRPPHLRTTFTALSPEDTAKRNEAAYLAVAILDHCGVAYDSVDVLQDMEIRQGIKAYSDWPTIPQLYVKGEFVGGSDIMMEMFEAGELQQMLDEKQVAKAS